MANVFPGRFTAKMDGPFVVFLIGMRVNRILAFGKWVPVFKAMGPMLQELYAKRELGFLHAEVSVKWRGVTMVSTGDRRSICTRTRRPATRRICRRGRRLIRA